MDSGRSVRRRKAAAEAGWADLPPELLTIISGCHQYTREIVRFRSVCRSWRSSTPLPPNKLSPFFPHTLAYGTSNITISATAVFLLRSSSDPSKPFLVSVQESVAGNLVLRHALSYKKIESRNRLLDPDSFEIQTVARSYTYNGGHCLSCNQILETGKMAFIYESFNSSIGLCSYEGYALSLRIDLNVGKPTTVTPLHGYCHELRDYVSFNGQIFALDTDDVIYLFDYTDLRLNPVGKVTDAHCKFIFVVSDGDLYLVSRCYVDDPYTCLIYRLVVKVTAGNRSSIEIELEKVEDLGDRVFVIGMDCAFSISAKNLPRPWKGNCVVFGKVRPSMCGCYRDFEYKGDEVFRVVGGQKRQRRKISSLQGYSDLFSPPDSAPSSKRRRLKA